MSHDVVDHMQEKSRAGGLRSSVSETLGGALDPKTRAVHAGFPSAWNALATMTAALDGTAGDS